MYSVLKLKRNFARSVFPGCTINFGGKVWTFTHTDPNNLSFGMCVIKALGQFNHKLGGQLLLHNLKLIIDFPHGSSIFIPSASLRHSNIPVAEGDTRISMTQYAAGPIFRWVDNGCQTERELKKLDRAAYERLHALKAKRWEMGLALLPTVSELIDYESTSARP
jgi:hypothetical protein